MLAKDPFSKESFIIYKITLNQSLINQKIDKIIIITLTSIFFIILFSSIVLLYIRKILSYLEEFTEHIKQEKQFKKTTYKELDETIKAYNKTLTNLQKALNSKEEFINFAMHEFATPINILSLYMNEYEEIKPAVKKLISSYKNLSFVIKDSNQKDTFNLKELILERIEYFKDIAMLENKTINYNLEDFIIQANREDIEILIDNNIKNAIKYSTSKEIFIHLKENILQFENRGKIKNPKEIFEKFYREEKVKGGFGLGLYIIKEITKKYNITINLKQLNDTIIFEYIFRGEDENSNS
jgi:signal transduction histidine kinase